MRLHRVFSASRKQYGFCPTWTLLVTLAKCAADVAKSHSWHSGRVHRRIGLVCTGVQMAEKNGSRNQQPAGKSNTVLMRVHLSVGKVASGCSDKQPLFELSPSLSQSLRTAEIQQKTACVWRRQPGRKLYGRYEGKDQQRGRLEEKQASASRIQIPPVKLC